MSSEEQWARIVEAVACPGTLPSPESRATLLQSAISLGNDVVPGIVGCSVTQAVQTDQGAGYRTPVASNELALVLDHAQYAADDGPCVAACRDGRAHSLAVIADERAFAGFTAAAVRHGVHSSLSLPLSLPRASALNLYAADPHAFAGPRRRAAASFLGRCVAGLLPEAVPKTAPRAVTSAIAERRKLIGRACAIIVEHDGCSPASAFHRLTVLSREQQRSVFDIARAIVGDETADAGQRS